MKLSSLKLKENNPRQITPEAIDKLAESIERDPEFMRLRPIVCDNDGTIIGGNQRFKALRQLGYKEVPDEWVVFAKDLTDEQKRRFLVVDNAPPGMAGDWDFDTLKAEFELPELEELGFDTRSLEDEVDALSEGEEIQFEQSVQIEPPKEYVLIMCEPESTEWEDLKALLQLRQVRRGGYKKGSAFDAVGLERVIKWQDVKKRLGVK